MSGKKKNFGDLKPGDLVWCCNISAWTIDSIKVVRITELETLSYYTQVWLEDGLNFPILSEETYYPYIKGGIWSSREHALKFMMKQAKIKEKEYVEQIDSLISKYDALMTFYEREGIKER